jgi:non-canonical purine NTP pyrophosphatase (RdgB/HAM1 family)
MSQPQPNQPQQPITFITGNAKKAEQLAWHLHVPMKHRKLDLVEIQSLDLREVVEDKARRAYEAVGAPVLVEDTSLVFNALGRLPGPLIKWFLKELDIEGLCRLLDGYTDRTALAKVLFGYFDGVTLQTFEGSWPGTIAAKPQGEQGFGWDPIFIPTSDDNPDNKTWGEMTMEEQVSTSMRREALQMLEKTLADLKG